jgi:hypothetical protein
MNDLTSILTIPGTTASGIASASQLVEHTSFATPQVGTTASPEMLIVLVPLPAHDQSIAPSSPMTAPLMGAEYPVLAKIWDNEEDEIFDNV